MSAVRLQSWAAPTAFVLLLGVLWSVGRLEVGDAMWLSLSVALAFGPSGMVAPGGWRRRAAEALLIPAGLVAVLVAGEIPRQMLLAPVVVAAGWASWSAAVRSASRDRAALLTGFFGLAARCSAGVGDAGAGWLMVAGCLALSWIGPWALCRFARSAGLLAALFLAIVPADDAPVLLAVVVAAAIVSRFGHRHTTAGEDGVVGWLPLAGALAMAGVALARWGVPDPMAAFSGSSWVSWVGLSIVLLVSLRLPAAPAGACAVLAILLLGPAELPIPEGAGFVLDSTNPRARLRPGNGGVYVLDVALAAGSRVGTGATVARVRVGSREVGLRLGAEVPDWLPGVAVAAGRGETRVDHLVVRPPAVPGEAWRQSGRVTVDVPDGDRPLIEINQKIKPEASLLVLASGPSLPTAPRRGAAERWLWWAAALVAVVQLASGSWRASWSWIPWTILASGLIATRMSVEPFGLLVQRHGVDLGLAAVLVAWVPAAMRWIRGGRSLFAAAVLLVPLAIASAHLTPPLWGDEPFHLALLESITEDGDLVVANNLAEGGGATSRLIRRSDRLLHSPVLALLLLPGFWLFGRAGALIELGLCGAGVVALVLCRLRAWIAPQRRVLVLVGMLACVTFPLATFVCQIWPGVVGALVVAACLVLASRGKGAGPAAVALAFLAAAVKTRLALVVFPVVLVSWWRQGRGRRVGGIVLIGVAAGAALLIGWAAMGHPFGVFRRLGNLLPTDPWLALRVGGGLLFDVAGGLAWTAPLWLLALAAAPSLWRRGGPGERALIVGGAATVFILLGSSEWYGGGSPPGRYLVPLLPAVLLSLGLFLSRPSPRRRLVLLLLPPSVVAWWALVLRPHFSINPGDGGWWLSNSLARGFSADARSLFPSFLVPTKATILVPVALVAVAGCLWWLSRSPGAARVMARLTTAVWLVAAAALVITLDLRVDGVVEAEAAQVRRAGGAPVPSRGAMARSAYRNGWRLANGHTLRFPLRVRAGQEVRLDGWVTPKDGEATIRVGWQGAEPGTVAVRGDFDGVRAPGAAPGDGRYVLTVECRAPAGTTIVIDKVVVEHQPDRS